MDQKKREPENRQNASGSALRILGSLYLMYMAYKMYTSIGAGDIGNVPVPLAYFSVAAFAAAGIVILISCFIPFIKPKKGQKEKNGVSKNK